jgi:N-acetylneuraminic acid mutarotase
MTNSSVSPKWHLLTPGQLKNSPGAIAHHTACVYANSAYILGGLRSNGSSTTEMYKYDILANKWEIARQQVCIQGQRDDHTCNIFNDTMVLFGGYKNGVRANDVLTFRFETGKWTDNQPQSPRPSPRSGHSAVIHQNNLVVCGGIADSNVRLNDVWLYDIPQNQWVKLYTTGDEFKARNGHTAIMLHD